MNTVICRGLRSEACRDCLGLTYRVLFYALATTPIWGAALAFAIIWHRLQP